jgi:hypothetical protein
LKAELESDEERGIQRALKNLAFTNGVGNFFFCYNLLFGEDLHGIDAFCVLFADLENFSKGPSSDKLKEFKVTGSQGSLRLLEMKVGYCNGCVNPVDTDLVLLIGNLDTYFASNLFIFKRFESVEY